MINGYSFLALLIYVDDIRITGDDMDILVAIKRFLHVEYTIKDLGITDYFLGIEIFSSINGLLVSQYKYLLDILLDTHLIEAALFSTPLPNSCKLSPEQGQPLMILLSIEDSLACYSII